MSILYQCEGNVKMPPIKRRIITAWIKLVAAAYGKKAGDISYVFCNDERILEINRDFLRHDYYTDIITFDYTDGNQIKGDMFISLDTVKSNAQKYDTTFLDELHRVMIHGVLHLCGFGDKELEEKKRMTCRENKALEMLKQMLA